MARVSAVVSIRLVISALKLIAKGQWRTLYWRIWIRLHKLDLSFVSVEDLGLSLCIAYHHSATPGPELRRVLKTLDIRPGSGIIDFGCGKGGALITMKQFPFSRITGCDISPGLLRVAETNMDKMRISSVRLICCDARQFTDLDEYDYFYFFNPFPREVFESVMVNIGVSLARKPREATIIYRIPSFHDIVVASGLFEKVADLFYGGDYPYYIYSSQPGKHQLRRNRGPLIRVKTKQVRIDRR